MGRKKGYRYRCSDSTNCRKRVTLPKHLAEYVRKPPACKSCGKPLTLDRCRQERKDTVFNSCLCDALPYPHRMGGAQGCKKIRKVKFQRGTYRGQKV